MLYLALYRGRGKPGNALVRWWTRSEYSHCELVVDDVWYSSSVMDGGVRSKLIELNPKHWDIMVLPESFGPRVLEHFEATKGQRYGWLDLIRSQLFNWNRDEKDVSFCSEWCAAALGIPNPTTYSPKTLADLLGWAWGGHINGVPVQPIA